MKLIEWVNLVFLCLFTGCLMGQPVLTFKKTSENIDFYRDLKDTTLYYFAPDELTLGLEKDGKPMFQLVEMRYTGTSLAGDQGEKSFINIVQLTILLKNRNATQLNTAKLTLGKNAKIQPLSLKNIEGTLFIPAAMGDKMQRVGTTNSLEGNENEKTEGLWQEKTYTLRLDNAGAQLLWEQVEKGQLAISFAYNFYADAIAEHFTGNMDMQGDSAFLATMQDVKEEAMTIDSTPTLNLVRSAAFAINIDPKQWPETLRKVDINESDGAPPGYAVLELKCFDFSNGLRPDLYQKSVEIEATGINGTIVKEKGFRFSQAKPNQTNHQVRFKFAVILGKPIRYRVTEVDQNGKTTQKPWQYTAKWATLIDVTSPVKAQPMDIHEVDVERTTEDNDQKLGVFFQYQQKGKPQSLALWWDKDGGRQAVYGGAKGEADLAIKTIKLYSDKDKPITYYYKWLIGEKWSFSPRRTLGVDDYIFLKTN
jgi:hypothetical protein